MGKQMKVENLIYVYMAVCVSMILFNCAVICINKRSTKKLAKSDRRLRAEILFQIERLKDGKEVEPDHVVWIVRRLKRIGKLLAFEKTMDALNKEDEKSASAYLGAIYPGFIALAMYYCDGDMMEATYYAYLVNKYRIATRGSFDFIVEAMMQLLTVPNMYCRENALHVIYRVGDAGSTVRALLQIDKSQNCFHHSKLIHDGLLEFEGDKEKLQMEIWKQFDRFTSHMQVALLQYMRLSFADCRKEVFDVMMASKQEDEVRFACMRYFGKFTYEPAYPVLLNFLANEEKRRWEYPAIAATVLGNYKSERTIELLTESLYNSNWYIRINAAKTLAKFRVTYADLVDVFEGNDRYAREILQYWLDSRGIESEKAVTA